MRTACGFTLIELLIVVAIIGVIAGVAVPSLLRARMSGNEASAVASLRAVNSAELIYSTSCAQGYAVSLAELASSPAIGGQPFISPDLSTSPMTKSGYTLTYTAGAAAANAAPSCTTAAQPPVVGYTMTADPMVLGQTGTRYFATTDRQTIYQNTAGPVTFTGGVANAPATSLK